jgi:hypothetical protein
MLQLWRNNQALLLNLLGSNIEAKHRHINYQTLLHNKESKEYAKTEKC